jgi:hypothetical protein
MAAAAIHRPEGSAVSLVCHDDRRRPGVKSFAPDCVLLRRMKGICLLDAKCLIHDNLTASDQGRPVVMILKDSQQVTKGV